jgi:hypothetical protein
MQQIVRFGVIYGLLLLLVAALTSPGSGKRYGSYNYDRIDPTKYFHTQYTNSQMISVYGDWDEAILGKPPPYPYVRISEIKRFFIDGPIEKWESFCQAQEAVHIAGPVKVGAEQLIKKWLK